ncbi:MAG: SpoIIE family protein phosphatase, partial [Candidatus Eremiobacteraeota bacterium]|nr:SpoIIE family protein phosphatase [Candidatus Eremiobacteraeota bacterium]
WRDVVHPDDLPRYDVALGQAGERDLQVQLDVRRRRPDGYFAWMRVTLRRINEPVGTFGVVGTVVDIDELTQLGQAVSESRERFRVLAEAMPQLVWSGAPDGTIDYVNQRFIEYTGWTAERLATESVPGIVHGEDRERTVRAWRESLSHGSEYEVEYRLRRASDGAFRWFIARAVPRRDESGNIVQWIGTATDVDAQRRSYENLQFAVRAANTLHASMNPKTICDELARLTVDGFADWCFVRLRDQHAGIKTVSMAHRDPELLASLAQYVDRYPARESSDVMRATFENRSFLYPIVSEELIRQAAGDDPERLSVARRLRLHSAITVPLVPPGGEPLGAVTMATAESQRAFDENDLKIAEMVAQRAAAALQNAQLFSEEKRTSQRLRFIARAGEMLFESLDLKRSFDRLVDLIVSESADFALLVLIENGEALRTVAIAHRDSAKWPLVDQLRGERLFNAAREKAAIESLARRTTQITQNIDAGAVSAAAQPYLLPTLLELKPRSSITVPLHSRGVTHGVLIAYYGESGRAYEDEDIPIFSELGRRASIAIEIAQSFERERHVAKTFQEAQLPSLLPELPSVRLNAVYESASSETIGGDWYDAFLTENGSLVVTVGDVTGRGLQAAVIMAKIRQAISVISLYETDPSRILDAADQILLRRFPDALVTAFVGILDPQRKTIAFANAGHPFPLLRRNGELVELAASGLPLGLRRTRPSAPSHHASLEGAELLVLFTDGLIEATRDLDEGEHRLRTVVGSDAIVHARDPARLIQEACLYDGSRDDVAVLVASFRPTIRWSFDAENARAAQDARGEFVRYVEAHAKDASEVLSAEVIFGELVSNVVRHAPGPIDIELDWSESRPILHVIDRGPSFAHRRDLPLDPLSESGRGLFIIRTLSQNFEVERIAGFGNHVIVGLSMERSTDVLS